MRGIGIAGSSTLSGSGCRTIGTAATRVILKLRRKDARRFFEESSVLSHPDTAIVTGAFSYTGRYVARRLLNEGVSVRTLARNPDQRDPFGDLVPAASLDFSDPDGLYLSMQGADVLYNTYWIRFGRGRDTFDQAVENSRVLFDAAARAGVWKGRPLLGCKRLTRFRTALLSEQGAG